MFVVAVCSGKGGVGKTSVVANTACEAAAAGWRVLTVDLDVQGNLGLDLGYAPPGSAVGEGGNDGGGGLLRSVQFGDPPQPVRTRERLDSIPGGWHLRMLPAAVGSAADPRGGGWGASDGGRLALRRVIEGIPGEGYDLVLLDCAPGVGPVLEAALTAANGMVVPLRCDAGSVDGLVLIGQAVAEVRAGPNPGLELLGVALFDVRKGASVLQKQVLAEIEAELGGSQRIFSTGIRHSPRAAFDMRQEGLSAGEYAAAAEEDQRRRLAWLRAGRPDLDGGEPPRRPSSAGGLAADYRALTREMLERVRAAAGEGQ